MKRQIPPLEETFMKRVSADRSGCLLWTGYIAKNGYGRIGVHRNEIDSRGLSCADGSRKWVSQWAHRIAWQLKHGPIPDNLFVLHRCDVRRCVNVEHLFLGTQLENLRDAKAKGRNARGESMGASVLTNEQVLKIRQLYDDKGQFIAATGALSSLAREFGVSVQALCDIGKRRHWKHL
jgi:hypothetical protein